MTVYERQPGGTLYVEWWDDLGRHQQSLRMRLGHPVTDKEFALEIAEDMAQAQKRKRNAESQKTYRGYDVTATVGQLLRMYHAAKARKWADTTIKGKDRYREFWLAELGATTRLVDVTDVWVEDIAHRAAEENDWSAATHAHYLKHIVAAFRFAYRKAKLIQARHMLSAVDIPTPDGKGEAYDYDEIVRLLAALEEVGTVPAWLGNMLWQTGRRLSAVRTLPKSAVTIGPDYALIALPRETDKARRASSAAVVGRAFELTVELMDGPGEYVAGRYAPSLKTCNSRWLPKAEDIAGIEHIKGRGWHGIKRRFATEAPDRRAASKQSGTNEDTLRKIYEQDDLAPKLALARELDAMLESVPDRG